MSAQDEASVLTPKGAVASSVLRGREAEPIAQARQGGLHLEVRLAQQHIWITIEPSSKPGLALRMPVFSADAKCRVLKTPGRSRPWSAGAAWAPRGSSLPASPSAWSS